MKAFKKIIAILLAVSLAVTMAGCAYNHPNPIARDISYGATAGALPGLAMMALLSESDEGADAEAELGFFGLSLIVLGGGAIVGTAVGAVVGVVQWFIETATYDPTKDPNHPDYIPPENLAAPAETRYQEPVQYESEDTPQAVRQGEEYVSENGPTAVRQGEPEETMPAAATIDPAITPAVERSESSEEDYAPAPVRQ